jgi:hypothetical protein
MADSAQALACFFRRMNDRYATDYPAAVGDRVNNTDSGSFQDLVAAISLRENERLAHTGTGWNPTWHRPIDVFETFSDLGFKLGLNSAQTSGTFAHRDVLYDPRTEGEFGLLRARLMVRGHSGVERTEQRTEHGVWISTQGR